MAVRGALNLLVFYVCWFTCVAGVAAGNRRLGLAVIAASVVLHMAMSPRPGAEGLLYLASAMLGYIADSVLVVCGLLVFPEGVSQGWPSPLWMVFLWVNFATTLNTSLAWMKNRLTTAAIFGAVGGPMTYLAGGRFGVAEFRPTLATSLVAIGVEWLICMPLLCVVARRLCDAPAPSQETREVS